MQVGFIGTGSMGSILIEAFVEANALLPSQIHASNRTFAKVERLAQRIEGLHAYRSNKEVALKSNLLFLCVKPLEFKKVLEEIYPNTHPEQIIVSITSPIQISELESMLPAKIAKIIPSITNSVGSGASLLIAGERLVEADKYLLYELFRSISHPLWIEERFTRVSSDIVSCGPAFMSYIVQQFIDGAVRETNIPKEQATALATYMMVGLGELLAQQKFSLPTLQERVCVPGGVTGAGLSVLEERMQDLFDEVIRKTHEKFSEDNQQVFEMFFGKAQQKNE